MNIIRILCATTVLYCGVASADPSTSEHTLKHHDELAIPMFCMGSYLRLLREVEHAEGRTHRSRELANRGRGLTSSIYEYADSLGHDQAEVDAVGWELYRAIEDLSHDKWVAFLNEVDCKGMTQQWAKIDEHLL